MTQAENNAISFYTLEDIYVCLHCHPCLGHRRETLWSLFQVRGTVKCEIFYNFLLGRFALLNIIEDTVD